MKVREEKLRTIIEWSEKNEDVRVLLLTSSLVNPLALVDEFSDLDIEFVFEDNTNYISDKSWTLKFGNPIAMIEEDESCFNHKHAMKMLLYEDGVKVDFKLYRFSVQPSRSATADFEAKVRKKSGCRSIRTVCGVNGPGYMFSSRAAGETSSEATSPSL